MKPFDKCPVCGGELVEKLLMGGAQVPDREEDDHRRDLPESVTSA